MALRLIDKIPGLRKVGILRKYSDYLVQSGFKVDALLWIILCVLISLIVGLIILLLFPGLLFIGLIVFLVIMDLSIGYPYLMAMKRIDQIEEDLPDALRQMSDTLRAGGTYEYALREIAASEYGPLKVEINNVLRKLEEGENLETALSTLSQNVDSRLVQRTVTIIIDSVRAGAGLADILENIAEDVRAMHRIDRERKSRTLMQVLFITAAGAIVAPMIFGFVVTIVNVLLTAASGAVSEALREKAAGASDLILLGVQLYIFIETLGSSMMIALMREGKISKSIIYFPILLFIAYIVYILAQFVSAWLVGTVG